MFNERCGCATFRQTSIHGEATHQKTPREKSGCEKDPEEGCKSGKEGCEERGQASTSSGNGKEKGESSEEESRRGEKGRA